MCTGTRVTTVDGIPHLTLQSLTESFVMSPQTGQGEACGTFGMLQLTAEVVDWRVFGADAMRAIIPVGQMARRWYPAMKNFAEVPAHGERAARIAAYRAKAQAAE